MSKRNLTALLGLVIANVALGAGAPAASPKPTGVKAEILASISDAESKLNQLAEAIPEEKYTWRPMEGVRSPAEVFMHVAAANYGIPSFWGVKPPEGFDFKTYEKSLSKKADIQKAMAASFVHVKDALMAVSNADLVKPFDFFGRKTTVRGGYIFVASHCHEHLGQMIAYARMNGVVPPWTAAENAQEAAALATKSAPK